MRRRLRRHGRLREVSRTTCRRGRCVGFGNTDHIHRWYRHWLGDLHPSRARASSCRRKWPGVLRRYYELHRYLRRVRQSYRRVCGQRAN